LEQLALKGLSGNWQYIAIVTFSSSLVSTFFLNVVIVNLC